MLRDCDRLRKCHRAQRNVARLARPKLDCFAAVLHKARSVICSMRFTWRRTMHQRLKVWQRTCSVKHLASQTRSHVRKRVWCMRFLSPDRRSGDRSSYHSADTVFASLSPPTTGLLGDAPASCSCWGSLSSELLRSWFSHRRCRSRHFQPAARASAFTVAHCSCSDSVHLTGVCSPTRSRFLFHLLFHRRTPEFG